MNNIIAHSSLLMLSDETVRRAMVITTRTKSNLVGILKSQMIDLLKAKLRQGICHFAYVKKDGSYREAWGTTASNLIKAKVNGHGISRDSVNCVCYWDVDKGGFRSLRFENLIQVF